MIGVERDGFICEVGVRFRLVGVAVKFVDFDFLVDQHVSRRPLLLRHNPSRLAGFWLQFWFNVEVLVESCWHRRGDRVGRG